MTYRHLIIRFLCCATVFSAILCADHGAHAAIQPVSQQQTPDHYTRLQMFYQMETLTGIPWYYLAAIDQFERSIQGVRKDKQKTEGLIAIQIPSRLWHGAFNPDRGTSHMLAIHLFNGMGRDGDGDLIADPKNDRDVLYTMASYIRRYGITEDHIRIALWEYYKRDKTVSIITEFANIYRHFGTLKLDRNVFPLPLRYNYSYRSTWGYARGWGGRRMHEGTDIFADYGTPVRSTGYGIVEEKGWNKYGGWRIGIRDLDNVYHYYAHLSRYNKDLKKGDVVEPGQVIGYVGSSGYGKKGTSGKFPPHLHYGMYKDNGRKEYSFDPYPHLKKWEREERKRKK